MADCMHKLTIKTNKGVFQVPCKNCIPCRKRRAAEIKRFCELQQQEYYRHGQSCSFNCLTYTEASLPLTPSGIPTIRKSDFINFMKRFRKNLALSVRNSKTGEKHKFSLLPFKYLACAEYGDEDHRPHYHFILFGISDTVARPFILKSWMTKKSPKVPLGKADVRPLLAGGISYVCDYVITSLNGELAKQKYDDNGLERPFTCHSQGLGIKYLLDNEDVLLENNFIDKFSGKPFLIPKYYRDYYNLDLSNSFNPSPCIEFVQKRAAKYSLSVSDFQSMQQRICVKNARMDTIGSESPVEQDFEYVPSVNKALVSSLVDEISPLDKIPF